MTVSLRQRPQHFSVEDSSSELSSVTGTITPAAASPPFPDISPPSNMSLVREGGSDGDMRPRSSSAMRALHNLTVNKLNLKDIAVYGREEEQRELEVAFENSGEAVVLASVMGYSGVGKSTLTQQLKDTVLKRRGSFCTGKFDAELRGEPYTALQMAMRDLAEKIQERDDADDVKKRILDLVGDDSDALTAIVPELGVLFDSSEGMEQVSASSASVRNLENRIHFIFRQFVQAISNECHPLVIVLDDMQWVDDASIRLIEALVTNPHCSSFLLVTTTRENEVDNDHAFVKLIDRCQGKNVTVQTINLDSLDVDAVNSIVSTALRTTPDETTALASIIHQKTNGNPFFVIQFLKMLHEEGILNFNLGSLKWHWDEEKVMCMLVTENVAGLLSSKLEKFPSQPQTVLQVAACLGGTFDEDILFNVIDSLSLFDTLDVQTVKACLDDLVDLGILDHYGRYFSFAHDAIQSAALALIPQSDAISFRLQIGRYLLSDEGVDQKEYLFRGVDLCNAGAGLLSDAEMVELAKRNLQTAEVSMSKSAFDSAFTYFEKGIMYLGASAWDLWYQEALQLHSGAAEAAYCIGDNATSINHINSVMRHASSVDDRIRTYQLRCVVLAVGAEPLALSAGRSALREMDMMSIPENPSVPFVMKELLKTRRLLKNQTRASLLDLPNMSDERRAAALAIADTMTTVGYLTNQNLLAVLVMKAVRWTVKYGISQSSPGAFCYYALIVSSVLGDVNRSFMYGDVAISYLSRKQTTGTLSKTTLAYYGLLFHWTHDLRKSIKPLMRGYRIGMANGEVEMAMANLGYSDHVVFETAGWSLGDLAPAYESHVNPMREYGHDSTVNFHCIIVQLIHNLLGLAEEPTLLKGAAADEDELERLANDTENVSLTRWLDSSRMRIAYLFGDYVRADKYAMRTRDYGQKVLPGTISVPRHFLFLGLSALAAPTRGLKRAHRLREATKALQRLQRWHNAGNPNVLPKMLLLEAELAAARGKSSAESLYRRAIVAATRGGVLNDKALAHERAALYHLNIRRDRYWAAHHTMNAVQAYEDWGATAKATFIATQYPDFVTSSGRLEDLSN